MSVACLHAQVHGKGVLVIAGGGDLGPEIVGRFLAEAGGANAPIVVIPTASETEPEPGLLARHILAKAGATNLHLLHTRDRAAADTREFAKPIAAARGVWFDGGRQWRLVDSYLNTRTHRELLKLLERGGAIGGSSAGATIQGSYLVRGAREGNHIMMAPGYEEGLSFLPNVAIDQHLFRRKREMDMLPVIETHPALTGLGIDEQTAVVVKKNLLEVVGASKVAVYWKDGPKPYLLLEPGRTMVLPVSNRRR